MKKLIIILFFFSSCSKTSGGKHYFDDSPCTQDSDCVLVEGECCGCSNGGKLIAIHVSKQAEYERSLQRKCSKFNGICLTVYLCEKFTKQCLNSTCQVIKQ